MLRVALIAALLLHAAALVWARYWLQAPSLLEKLPPPFYTRVLHPQAEPEPPLAAAPRPSAAPRKRRTAAHAGTAPVIMAESTAPSTTPAASAPQPEASVAEPAASAASAAASAAEDAATADSQADSAAAPAAAPSAAASAAPPAFFKTWPTDTRLTYVLTGNYRGQLHGRAWVTWQRLFDGQQTRYQTQVKLSLGLLLSMQLTSQGRMTDQGLAPEVYEQQIDKTRRQVRIGDDVQLNNGKRVARPDDVQDTASQFIELAHRFATGQAQLTPGNSVHLWLARPTGVDEWVYDVLGEETLYLPTLGTVRAIHLKPRRLDQPNGSINAEIWLAPSLQYLPVRILLTRGEDTSADLMVEHIDQQ